MWGLGLFFSVQFSLQYGLFGLLTFAIPNALGLVFFGGVTQLIARRAGNGPDALGAFFATWSRPYRLIFFLYQILAITLTVFALVRYAWQPLGLEPAGLICADPGVDRQHLTHLNPVGIAARARCNRGQACEDELV